MAEAMAPRGPDGAGVWSQGRVALGPPSPEDHRPVRGGRPADGRLGAGPDRRLQRLHLQLQASCGDELIGHGYRFFSHSDTEVLLKAYHHWGDRFVDHLTGMFAFAIVERDSGRVLLGRDRLGIKPLYLTEDARRASGSPRRCPRCSPAAASTPASTRSRCTTT